MFFSWEYTLDCKISYSYNIVVSCCHLFSDLTRYFGQLKPRIGGNLRIRAIILPVFMSRRHIPKLIIAFLFEVLVLSVAFYNVLARQRSSFCYRTGLNYEAFSLRD